MIVFLIVFLVWERIIITFPTAVGIVHAKGIVHIRSGITSNFIFYKASLKLLVVIFIYKSENYCGIFSTSVAIFQKTSHVFCLKKNRSQIPTVQLIAFTVTSKDDHKTHQFKKLERIQSNANHPLAESMGYIKFEGM